MFAHALESRDLRLKSDCEALYYQKNRPFALFIFNKCHSPSNPGSVSFSKSDIPPNLLQGIKKIKNFPFTFFSKKRKIIFLFRIIYSRCRYEKGEFILTLRGED